MWPRVIKVNFAMQVLFLRYALWSDAEFWQMFHLQSVRDLERENWESVMGMQHPYQSAVTIKHCRRGLSFVKCTSTSQLKRLSALLQCQCSPHCFQKALKVFLRPCFRSLFPVSQKQCNVLSQMKVFYPSVISLPLIALDKIVTLIVRTRQQSSGTLTWFNKLVVQVDPGLSALPKTLFHGSDIQEGAVAVRKLGRTSTPAIIVAAQELALRIACHVAERCLHEAVAQEVRENIL